jgi:RmuC family
MTTIEDADNGTRALPDAIIHLPEGRSLVIDSKVSLVAYEEFAITENELERTAAGKRHMESIKGHIKGLSGKNYQSLYSLNSLDFVLLFLPIEPAVDINIVCHLISAGKREPKIAAYVTLWFLISISSPPVMAYRIINFSGPKYFNSGCRHLSSYQ